MIGYFNNNFKRLSKKSLENHLGSFKRDLFSRRFTYVGAEALLLTFGYLILSFHLKEDCCLTKVMQPNLSCATQNP